MGWEGCGPDGPCNRCAKPLSFGIDRIPQFISVYPKAHHRVFPSRKKHGFPWRQRVQFVLSFSSEGEQGFGAAQGRRGKKAGTGL